MRTASTTAHSPSLASFPSMLQSNKAPSRRREVSVGFMLIVTALIFSTANYYNLIKFIGVQSKTANKARSLSVISVSEPAQKTDKAAFVCITGQLQRLELHNKIKTVLTPLREAGYEPYISLMLTDDQKPRYTNVGNHFGQAFDNFTQAHTFLTEHNGFVVLNDRPIVQPNNPILNEDYAQRIEHNPKRHPDLPRTTNHARMFHTMTQCGEEMMKAMQGITTTGPPPQFGMIVRVREDVGLTDPMEVEKLHEELYSTNGTLTNHQTVISSFCRRHKGMNDRMAVVSPEAAYQYFHAPFAHLYTKRSLAKAVKNPETYIRHMYEKKAGLTVIDSKTLRYVVKLEPTQDGSFVLMKSEDKTYCLGKMLPDHILDDPIATQLLGRDLRKGKEDTKAEDTKAKDDSVADQ